MEKEKEKEKRNSNKGDGNDLLNSESKNAQSEKISLRCVQMVYPS
jgi:hypothetical protein